MVRKITLVLFIAILILSSCTIAPPTTNNEPTIEPTDIQEISADNESPEPTADKSNTLVVQTYRTSNYGGSLKRINSGAYAGGMIFEKYDFEFIEYIDTDPNPLFESYSNDLIKRLLAGDSSFDIYEIFPSYMNCIPFIENEYFVDLGKNTELAAQFDLMFDDLKTESMYEGKIFGFPYIEYYPLNIMYSIDALGILENDISGINTFEDLFLMDDIYMEKTGSDSRTVRLAYAVTDYELIKALLYGNFDRETYSIDFSSFDITLSKSIFAQIKDRNYDEALGMRQVGSGLNFYYSYSHIINDYNVYGDICTMLDTAIKPLYLDKAEKDGNRIASMRFYVINPYSEKADLALDLLLDYAETLKVRKMQEENPSWPLRQYHYKDIDTYIENELGLKPPFKISQERLDTYAQIIENMQCFWKFNGYDECAEILMQYYNDEIEHDTAIDNMQRIMDTVSREYTLD